MDIRQGSIVNIFLIDLKISAWRASTEAFYFQELIFFLRHLRTPVPCVLTEDSERAREDKDGLSHDPTKDSK